MRPSGLTRLAWRQSETRWRGGELPDPIERNRDCSRDGLVDGITAETLEKYLQVKGEVMKGLGSHLVSYGKRFDVDPRLLVALAGAETTFGKYITSGKHNAWNWLWNAKEPSNSDFDSWESAIHSVSKGLRKGYLNRGLDTTSALYGIYCSGDCQDGLRNLEIFLKEQAAPLSGFTFPCVKNNTP